MFANISCRSLALAAALCTALTLSACGGNDDPPPQGTVIGAAGGTVAGPNGAMVVIPPGALASDTTIAVSQTAAGAPAIPGGFVVFGQTFAFTPHGTTFALPVTVTVPFDPSLVPALGTPVLYKTDAQGPWQRVANATVNAASVSAQVSGFSWVILGNVPPAITQQPQDASVVEPAAATFSVAAFGTPALQFQWQRSDDGGTTWGPPATGTGATSASYTTAATSVGGDNGARFRVIIDSPEGATTSNVVALTVTAAATTSPRLTLNVVGNGKVTSNPSGINCPGDCSEDYLLNAMVALTPTPAGGFTFTSWSGDADCGDGSVFMNSARNCTATFSAAPGASSATARIAAGDGFSVAKLANGQMRSWGTDDFGQLGDDPGDMSRDVVGPVDILVDAQFVAASTAHTVVVRGNGQVRGWGYNGFGQLGDGTNFTRTVPTVMSNGAANLTLPASPLENAANVCAGALHTIVRLATGRLVATGRNIDGQLGDGSNVDRLRPVLVDDGTGSFSADVIACGLDHTVAVVGGQVYTWGGNATGQLGNGSTTPRNRPAVVSGPSGVKAIAAGDGYTLAVDGQGNLWTWGSNTNGKLGDGTEVDRLAPVQITSAGGVTAVVATGHFSMALIGGVVYTWGINEVGQLANGGTSPGYRTTRAPAVGLPAGIVEIAASGAGGSNLDHALAVDGSGNVWSWGYNANGQLGTGSANGLEATPRQVPNLNLN